MKQFFTSVGYVLVLLLTTLSTGCQHEHEALLLQGYGRKLTLTASMPQDAGGVRVGLKKGAEGNTLIARWKAKDKVTFIFEQGALLTTPVEVAVSGITQNGKQAKLKIEVPESIDIAKRYTIHAFCGVPGEGVRLLNKEIVVDLLPLRSNKLEDIVVPVISKKEIDSEVPEEVYLRFEHLGSIEYVDLKNNSIMALRVENCHLYPIKGEAEEWRYLPRNGKHHLYKPMTDEVVEADGDRPDPLRESGSAVSVGPGATYTFAVWHRPTGKNIPEFGISIQTDKGIELSENKKTAKPFSMVPGKAYRVKAEWEDNSLRILGEGVEEDLPFMTLTTRKTEGEWIELRTDAKPEDRPHVWIDLNNNRIKESNEKVKLFEGFARYRLGSQTIAVYGKVTVFVCREQEITSLDVSNNTALEGLSCGDNHLTSLDVSKNTALDWLNCGKNRLTTLDVSRNTILTLLACAYNGLTTLDVSRNTALDRLNCTKNSLSSLNVSRNTALTSLTCGANHLTTLDVSKNTALKELSCGVNQLTSLDVSKNIILEELWCTSNQITSLDVSKNTALKELSCGVNQLTSLDVSNNTALYHLDAQYNRELSSLKISGSITNLLAIGRCKLDTETLNTIFRTLPNVEGQGNFVKPIFVFGNPGTDTCNKRIAEKKGWTVYLKPPVW
ncbi:MAG: hypothetical protein Q3998_06395 [Porphyromonas sp.]|nr:hypothetical protein [Porphyromonas sp.]